MSKPNFCPACGTARGKGSVPPQASRVVPRRAIARQVDAKDDPDGTDVESVPDIGELQYEIDGDYTGIGSRLVPLNDVVGSNVSPGGERRPPEVASPETSLEAPASPPTSPPSETEGPTTQEKFNVVKQSIEDCKSSANNAVDVGEK